MSTEPDADPEPEVMGAHWRSSTGAGDDVLEAHCEVLGLSVHWQVTAARLRQLADAGQLAIFGPVREQVESRLELYRLAHEPDRARNAEADARAALARRRTEPQRLADLIRNAQAPE